MNDMRTLLMATAFLAATGVAQDPGSSPSVGKPSVGGSAAPSAGKAAKVDVQAWIRQLGSDSYRERLEAETKLLELGSQESGQQIRSALEAAAGDDRDGEVQWRAKRVLRRIEKGGIEKGDRGGGHRAGAGLTERRRDQQQEPSELRRDQGRRGPGVIRLDSRRSRDIQQEFDRLFERMEKDFGLDVPRHRFFDDRFFQDLRSQLQPIRPQDVQGPGSSGRSTSVQVGPGGVVVEVTETDEDGKEQTKKYEAPDMETFRKNHPDVLQGNGLGFGFGRRSIVPRQLRGSLGPVERDYDRRARTIPGSIEPEAPPAGERLGVLVEPIPEALRDYLELGAEIGLMVGSVQPGTLAEALELRAGDIVTRINKSAIGGAADVRRSLAKISKGELVKVSFLRRGRELEAEAKKRHDAGAAGRVELQPKSMKKQARRQSIR